MKVLVGFASRHGSTQGIAARIGERLAASGLDVAVQRVEDVRDTDVEAFDAFVIGSAAYMGHWLKPATRFVERHRDALGSHPTWLFSSGPIGPDRTDKQGRDVLKASEPRELGELGADVGSRSNQVFFGAFDPDAPRVGVWERIGAPFMQMPAVRDAMPAGDFRDWPAIEAWADEIATALKTPVAVG